MRVLLVVLKQTTSIQSRKFPALLAARTPVQCNDTRSNLVAYIPRMLSIMGYNLLLTRYNMFNVLLCLISNSLICKLINGRICDHVALWKRLVFCWNKRFLRVNQNGLYWQSVTQYKNFCSGLHVLPVVTYIQYNIYHKNLIIKYAA